MADAPDLVALALLEWGGQRALCPSPANPSVLKLPPRPTAEADGYTLALELLLTG